MTTRSLMAAPDEWRRVVREVASVSSGGETLNGHPEIAAARSEMARARRAQGTQRALLQAANAPQFQGLFQQNSRQNFLNCTTSNLLNPSNLLNCLGVRRNYELQQISTLVTSNTSLTGQIEASPYADIIGNRLRVLWLSSNGDVLQYAQAVGSETQNPPQYLFNMSKVNQSMLDHDTFKTQFLVGTSNGNLYATGSSGRLYSAKLLNTNDAVPTFTVYGADLDGQKGGVLLDGTQASLGRTPGCYRDNATGYVVTVSNKGFVQRWQTSPSSADLTEVGSHFEIPLFDDVDREEIFTANGVCFANLFFVGSVFRDRADPNVANGRFITVNLATNDVQDSFLNEAVRYPGPFDFDGAGITETFLPGGHHVNYIYRQGTSYLTARSRALVVTNASAATGNSPPALPDPALVDPSGEGISNIPQAFFGDNNNAWVAATNANALFTMNYSGATPAQKAASFTSATKTRYAKLASGLAGFSVSGSPARYTRNPCGPQFDFRRFGPDFSMVVADNAPSPNASTRTFMNVVDVPTNGAAAPTLRANYDLRLTGNADQVAATQLPGASIGFTSPGLIYFATSSNTTNATQRAAFWLQVTPP